MSFIFSIPAPRPVSSSCLLSSLPGNDTHVLTIGGEDIPELLTESVLFYKQGTSTRGIWLQPSDKLYEIRINTLASKEDYLLAIELAVCIANLTGTSILPEHGTGFNDPDSFRTVYNDQWAEQNKMLGFDLVRYMVNKNEPVCLHGCFHDFHIGARFVAMLSADQPDDATLYERIITAFRKTQFHDNSGYFIPNVFQATDKNQLQWTYVVLAHDTATFLKKADYLMLAGPGDEFEEIAFEQISGIANEYFTPVDEYQYFVSPIPAQAFNTMMKKARKSGTAPGEKQDAPRDRKKWWRFWQ